jgi:hypothetical protein
MYLFRFILSQKDILFIIGALVVLGGLAAAIYTSIVFQVSEILWLSMFILVCLESLAYIFLKWVAE